MHVLFCFSNLTNISFTIYIRWYYIYIMKGVKIYRNTSGDLALAQLDSPEFGAPGRCLWKRLEQLEIILTLVTVTTIVGF